MTRLGVRVSVIGTLVSLAGTLLLFVHTTNKYHAAIGDMGSIAVAYLGLVVCGVAIAVTGLAVATGRT